MMSRTERIEQLQSEEFDVVVIGGGITGAGILLKCVEQGWKTALVERNDYASGTSCRSAKMIHGGLRYLEYMQIKLVKEALEERENLLTRYSHLVRPLPFVLPVYKSAFEKVKLKIGLSGYDALSGSSSLPGHESLSTSDMKRHYPMLKSKGLKGGFKYYDALTNDARLTNDVIMEANYKGATALNYISVESFRDRVLQCEDILTGEQLSIRTKMVVSATGIFTDRFLKDLNTDHHPVMKPSKGVHLILDGSRFPKRDVLLIPTTDKRFLWICPWVDGLVLVGATDTPFNGELQEPGVTKDDVDYIISNCNRYLQGFQLKPSDILSSFSGLRPLLDEDGEEDTTKVSRDYKIWWQERDLLTIAGGKLTSFLSMADSVVRRIKPDRKMVSSSNEPSNSKAGPITDSPGLDGDWARLFEEALQAPDADNPAWNSILTVVTFFIKHQQVEKLSDVLTRRLALTYRMGTYPESFVQRIAAAMQEELNWTDDVKKARIDDYKRHWESLHDHLKTAG